MEKEVGIIKSDNDYSGIAILKDLKQDDLILSQSARLRSHRTRKEKIKYREGKSGKTFKYIDSQTAMSWLDKNFPGWSMETIDQWEFAGYYNAKVKITVIEFVRDNEDKILSSYQRVIQTIGSKEIMLGKDDKKPKFLDYGKMAETDALKRAVHRLGGFSDVYSDFVEEEIDFELPEEDATEFLKLYKNIFMKTASTNESSTKKIENLEKQIKALRTGHLTIQQIKDYINQ